MALVKCKECGAEISTKAVSCPKCGAVRKGATGLVMKALAWLIGISVVIGIISAATGPHAPSGGATTAAETPPTSEQRAAVLKAEADRKAYYEAQDAKRSAEFARNRPTILARAKALSAAGNYQGALALGSGYLWANDAELDAITRPRPGEGSGSDRAR